MVVDEIQSLCPSFAPAGAARRTTKSLLLPGRLDSGQRVIAKKITHADPVWRWYFDRELWLYRAFERDAPPVRVPRLHAADESLALMVIEHVPGAPLATGRAATRALDRGAITLLLAACDRLNRWSRGLEVSPRDRPAPTVTRAMRARLLEDPSASPGWYIEGFTRCAALGILSPPLAERMRAAIEAHPAVAFAHGDLLLRNVVRDPDTGDVAVVDWECAGPHPEDWDRALLWTGVPPARRIDIETSIRDRHDPAREAAFFAGVAFALAREIHFRIGALRRRDTGGDARLERLRADLRQIEAAMLHPAALR